MVSAGRTALREGCLGFYPPDTPVPAELRGEGFVARPLSVAYATQDYAAYIGSPDTIRVHSGGQWKLGGYTREEHLAELRDHERRHAAREDFAYILLDPAERDGLGCVYLLPLRQFLRRVGAPAETLAAFPEGAAMVTFWVRQGWEAELLDAGVLVPALRDWLRDTWRFPRVVFRANPEEERSLAALEASDARRTALRRLYALATPEPPHLYLLLGDA